MKASKRVLAKALHNAYRKRPLTQAHKRAIRWGERRRQMAIKMASMAVIAAMGAMEMHQLRMTIGYTKESMALAMAQSVVNTAQQITKVLV